MARAAWKMTRARGWVFFLLCFFVPGRFEMPWKIFGSGLDRSKTARFQRPSPTVSCPPLLLPSKKKMKKN